MTDDAHLPTAADVVRRHLARFDAGIHRDLADAYDPAAVVEQPFLPGTQRRLEGRDAIRAHFAAAASMPLRLRVRNLVLHETLDPGVVIAEYDYDVVVTASGETFTIANIQVFRIRNGLILSSRDYHDHARLASALHGGPA
jgi:ketosteroid isomerase-like protein